MAGAHDSFLKGLLRSNPVLSEVAPFWSFRFQIEGSEQEVSVEVPDYAFSPYAVAFDSLVGLSATLLHPVCSESVWRAQMVVLDNDFLMDISALSECEKHYGFSALNHLFSRLQSSRSSLPMLLGNIANFFFDAFLHRQEQQELTYKELMQRYFSFNALEIITILHSASPQEEQLFFEESKRQFVNIERIVNEVFVQSNVQIEPSQLLIEPSFLSPRLGIQGRMDAVSADYTTLIELKSGKGNEYMGRIGHQATHYMQMLLYFMILRWLPNEKGKFVKAYLLYSRYPLLIPENPSEEQAFRALGIRNDLLLCDRAVANKGSAPFAIELLSLLTSERLNQRNLNNKLWTQYLRPDIEAFQKELKRLTPTEQLYLGRIYTFITTEINASRHWSSVSEETISYSRRNATAEQKLEQGALLESLFLIELLDENLTPQLNPSIVGGFCFRYRPELIEQTSFRKGDLIVLYPKHSEHDSPISQATFKGYIAQLTEETLSIALSAPQRSSKLFVADTPYAIEYDHSEGNLTQMYRGISSFLRALPRRRQLLLEGPFSSLAGKIDSAHSKQEPDLERAVRKSLEADELFLLVGPPGTGKTSMAMKRMVEQLRQEGKQLLLLSYTNRAVDEICQMLETISDIDYLRIGKRINTASPYHHRLFEGEYQAPHSRTKGTERLRQIPIVVGTVSTLSHRLDLLRLKSFDVAIVDEATQIVEAQLLTLFCEPHPNGQRSLIDRFILIGDPKQLPAVVQQSPEQSSVSEPQLTAIGITNMRESLFERHYRRLKNKKQNDHFDLLSRQGRMHPSVADFVNRHFYEGKLRPIPLAHQQRTRFFTTLTDTPFCQTLGSNRLLLLPITKSSCLENPKVNIEEVKCVVRLLKQLDRLYQQNLLTFSTEKSIGIITPYRNQVAAIRRAINEWGNPLFTGITIDTVERYQGSQRDIIIYSLCLNHPYQLELSSDIIQEEETLIDRKLNVALSRAREHIYIVGNPNLMHLSPLLRKLTEELTLVQETT